LTVPDYSDPATPSLRMPVPRSRPSGPFQPTYYTVEDLRDPIHQKFHAVARLSGNAKRNFATHILPHGDTRFVQMLLPLKWPGTPVFLPRPHVGGYLPMLQAAMADFAADMPIDQAMVTMNSRMGNLSPRVPGQEIDLFINGRRSAYHEMRSDRMTATMWHMDDVCDRHQLAAGTCNKAYRTYFCANRLRTAYVKANRGFDVAPLMDKTDDLGAAMAAQLAPEEIGYTFPFTVYRFLPPAVHSGEDVTDAVLEREGCLDKGQLFRHFATLNIFIPDESDLRAARTAIHQNGPLYQWMMDHGHLKPRSPIDQELEAQRLRLSR
jgi:hypothetical protein